MCGIEFGGPGGTNGTAVPGRQGCPHLNAGAALIQTLGPPFPQMPGRRSPGRRRRVHPDAEARPRTRSAAVAVNPKHCRTLYVVASIQYSGEVVATASVSSTTS